MLSSLSLSRASDVKEELGGWIKRGRERGKWSVLNFE
jgi:hypothetical protein